MNGVPARVSSHHWSRFAVWLMAVWVAGFALVWAFFPTPEISIDDLGLMNPVYMYVHTGKLTYPSYGFFDAMFVHPPTHYLMVAWLLKLGVPQAYVASIPPLALILLSVWFIANGEFSPVIKVCLLFGFLAGVLFPWWRLGPSSFTLRPEAHAAFAWFAGLIALENGRLSSWNPLWLGIGSFLLTYASGIHYPMGLAWTGGVVYIIWVLRERGWKAGATPLSALIAGGCAFGLPFLALFLIPHWSEITSFINEVSPVGTIFTSLQEHVANYRLVTFPRGWIAEWFYFPLRLGLPTVVLSIPVLLWKKETRGIALAGLPLVLFVMLFIQRKPGTVYLFPEFALYGCAIGILIGAAVTVFTQKMVRREGWPTPAVLSVLLSVILIAGAVQLGATNISFERRLDHMSLARAAGRQILGANALVGARISRFFIFGEDRSYSVDPDLLWIKLKDKNLGEYFEGFDAIAEDAHMSDVSANERNESLSSWYENGTLSLRGFYFSHFHQAISYLLLHPHPAGAIRGYGLLATGEVASFQQESEGDHIFVAAICARNQLSGTEVPMLVANSFLLPPRAGGPLKVMMTFVARRQEYTTVRAGIATKCGIRDEIPLRMGLVEKSQLLASLKGDQVIRFYPTYEQAVDARWGPEMQVEIAASGWPQKFQLRRGAREGEAYSLTEEAKILARSEMEEDTVLKEARYGKPSPSRFVPDGITSGDRARSFRPESQQDHLYTELAAPAEGRLVFFSVWVSAEEGKLPQVSLRDEDFYPLARARPVAKHSGGWTLLAGWAERPSQGGIRLAVEPKGREFRFDKLLLAQVPSEALAKKRGWSVR